MSAFTPKISRRGVYYFAEIMQASGPQTIGVTGDNTYATLFGREWLLVLDREAYTLHLYQESSEVDGEWAEVTAGLPSGLFGAPLAVDARRITFAFDQSARLITAYESGGIVKVTRWDTGLNDYVQNVSFAACDPSLLMDATITRDIPRSDVALFYLPPDRDRVCYRIQAENYGTEHDLIALDEPGILDRAHMIPYRYQLLLSDATGDTLPEALRSALYPVSVHSDLVPALTGPTDGELRLVVLAHDGGEGEIAPAFTGPAEGDYREPIVEHDGGSDGLTAAFAGPVAGDWRSVILSDEPDAHEITPAFTGPVAGAILLVVIQHEVSEPHELTASFTGPVGGTYASA